MNRVCIVFVAVLTSVVSGIALAAGKDPRDEFRNSALVTVVTCGLQFQSAILSGQTNELDPTPEHLAVSRSALEGFVKCVDTAKSTGKVLAKRASVAMHTRSGKEAVSRCYGAFIAALDGILPGEGEPVTTYGGRQTSLQDTLKAYLAAMELAE